jgi:GrpB-like predicted nucleotidyltransferase (UPF0157 family)
MSTIEIHPPSAAWPDEFQALKSRLVGVLPRNSVIHHTGSTAVPGLAAKDVIDIQVSIDSLDQVNPAAIVALGFKHREISGPGDHCPPGMDLPDPELTKLFLNSTGRAAHVRVRERGHFNQRYALLCRDFLRSHQVAAQAYALVKHNLARHVGDDQDAYYDIKDPASTSSSTAPMNGRCASVGPSRQGTDEASHGERPDRGPLPIVARHRFTSGSLGPAATR